MNEQLSISHSRRYDIEGRYSALLDAGEILLCEGYENAKPQQIAKMAKVSVGLFYRHFKNKQELLTAITVKHLGILHRQIDRELEAQNDPVLALDTVLILTISYFQQHQGLIKLFFMQIGYGNATAIEQLKESRQKYRNILECIIQQGITKNIFVTLDVPIAINSIIGTINWSLYDLLIVNNENIESSELANKLLVHFLRGLGSQAERK